MDTHNRQHSLNTADSTETIEAPQRIADALERIAPAPSWLTKEQAARHLQVSTSTLHKVVKEKGHLDGGPCDVGEGRKMLRLYSPTIDDWFREACGIRPPAPPQSGRRRPRKMTAPSPYTDQTPVDWSMV